MDFADLVPSGPVKRTDDKPNASSASTARGSRPLLILDLGRVLVDVRFSRFGDRIAQVSERSADEVIARWGDGEEKHDLDRGVLAPERFVSKVASWAAAPALDVDVVRDAWCGIFDPLQGAESFLAELPASVDVWILSDTDPLHTERWLGDHPYLARAERLFLSCRRGKLKRDPGGFSEVVEAAGTRPALFVDDLVVNVDAGQRAGLESVLFRGWQQDGDSLRTWVASRAVDQPPEAPSGSAKES